MSGVSRPLLLVALVVLAGCGALVGDPEPTPTVSPAPVPETGTESTGTPGQRLAPGVTTDGVVAPARLQQAHVDRLVRTGYVRRTNRTVRYENGTLRSRTVGELRVDADRDRVYRTTRVAGTARSPERTALWSDGDDVLQRVVRDGEVTYVVSALGRAERSQWRYVPADAGQDAGSIFTAVETTVVGRQRRDGTDVYHVRNRALGRPAMLASVAGLADPRRIRLRARIDDRGVLRAYRLTYVATADGARVRVVRTARWRAIGTATVDRPPWYDAALASVETPAAGSPSSADGPARRNDPASR